MLKHPTCQTCHYFEEIHNMCTKQHIFGPLGTAFATRTPDSPACWSDYFRKPEPGEVDALFEKMKIERPHEPMPTVKSVQAFL